MATIHFGIREYIMKLSRESSRANAYFSRLCARTFTRNMGLKNSPIFLGSREEGENNRVGVFLLLISGLGIYLPIKGIGTGEPNVTSPFYPLTAQTARLFRATSRSEPGADLPLQFDDLVRRVQMGDPAGMLDLYECISSGLRPYLARQLRPQDYRDKIHSIFVDMVVAIQHGQLREPERLMGFARTIARRKVSLYIEAAASDRRNHVEIGSLFGLASPRATPEQEMVSLERSALVRLILTRLSEREAEILSRFYLQEQTEMQIRSEMALTHTQYRLLKWRSKAHFERLSRKQMASRLREALSANSSHRF